MIVDKACSLIDVATALPARLAAVPLADVAAHWGVVVNLLAGSLVGARPGAHSATRMHSATLARVLAALLLLIAALLAATHFADPGTTDLAHGPQVALGVLAGVGIGVAAALVGVAGGEHLIPAIVPRWGLDVKLAGSLSLAVSLPTRPVALQRYRQDRSFAVRRDRRPLLTGLAAGSVAGTVVGGLLVGAVPSAVIVPLLVVLLAASSARVWRHAGA